MDRRVWHRLARAVWPAWRRVPVRQRRAVMRGELGEYRAEGREIVLVHRSGLFAALAAVANTEEFGHPAWVERVDGRWCCVVNLRPALAELDAGRIRRERMRLVRDVDGSG